jgi:hypothetical protein
MKSKTPTYVENSGEYPIVLKSVKLITTGCSRDIDTPLKPGEGKEAILECSGTHDTLEVIYLRTVDGKTTTIVETGMITEYPESYLRGKCIIS